MPKNSQSNRIVILLQSGQSVPEVAKTCKVSQRYVYSLATRRNCPTNARIAPWGQREHKMLRDIIASRACSIDWARLSTDTGLAVPFLKSFVDSLSKTR
jgi:hypothetical protein